MSDKYNDEFHEWLNNVNKDNKDQEVPNRVLNNTDKISEVEEIRDNQQENVYEAQNVKDEEFRNQQSSEQQGYTNNNEYRRDINQKENKKEKKKSGFGFFRTVSLVLIGAILGSFLGPIASNYLFKDKETKEVVQETQKTQPISISTKQENNIENAVAKKAIQSVVGINVKYQSERDIFGQSKSSEGIGSGIIVSENGYILTNSHVLSDKSKEITVIFSDNSHAKAEIVWNDSGLDLGVIKVKKEGLTPIEFADSDQLQIGDKAIAIGNPVGLNLQSTLTSGYISGLNRTITMQNGMIMNGLIQTDASINSGNSGGALLNAEGKLVGINTAKAGSTDGIGFAIPSNIAKSIVEKIIKDGYFEPIILGIRGIDLVNYMQYTSRYDLGTEEGVFVVDVVAKSSAGRMGMKKGDIIVKINNDKITSMNTLKQALIKYNVGDTAKITYIRDGKEKVSEIRFDSQEDLY